MAAFTTPSEIELRTFLHAAGLSNYEKFQSVEGGSVNSNFSFVVGDSRWFLRIYEEQDARGAAAEQAMVSALAKGGVPTPVAAFAGTLAGKPAAILPWVEGTLSCQRGVSAERATGVGAALARVHLAGEGIALPEGRFHIAALEARLDRIPTGTYPVARLRTTLQTLAAARDTSVPHGLVHGDLFRDNVLWHGDEIVALLDFESASHGSFVYDLAVTILAWCYGDVLEAPLARAMAAGYASVRPMSDAEKRALYTEARLAAVRFTITRITDYAMPRPASGRTGAGPTDAAEPRRGGGGEGRVMKDWKRFLGRLDALEAMGEAGFAALLT